jgi:hypothetical protein
LSRLGILDRWPSNETAVLAIQGSPQHWKFPNAHIDPRYALGFQNLCRQEAKVIENHENASVRNIRQGETRRRKCEDLKLGGGQA